MLTKGWMRFRIFESYFYMTDILMLIIRHLAIRNPDQFVRKTIKTICNGCIIKICSQVKSVSIYNSFKYIYI